jgi:hypothetical protein
MGPAVDEKIVQFASVRFQPAANLVSWIACVLVLILAFVGVCSSPIKLSAAAVLGPVPAVHLALMLKRKFALAYWCASGEVLLALFAFAMFMIGDPEHGQHGAVNIDIGTTGFWLFISGSFAFATIAWLCHKAAKDIWTGRSTVLRFSA